MAALRARPMPSRVRAQIFCLSLKSDFCILQKKNRGFERSVLEVMHIHQSLGEKRRGEVVGPHHRLVSKIKSSFLCQRLCNDASHWVKETQGEVLGSI